MGKGGKGKGGKDKGKGKGKARPYEPEGPPDEIEEIGESVNDCEDELVCKCTNSRVPHFNARIFLENKEEVGRLDEIFGPINHFFFSVKMAEGMKASSMKKGNKFYIDNQKLLPLARFLPEAPKGGGKGKGGKGKGKDKGKGKGKGKGKDKGKGKGKGFGGGFGGGTPDMGKMMELMMPMMQMMMNQGGGGGGDGGGKGFGKADNFKGGDWNCPSCGDHQFGRNETCRKCDTPKPEWAGFKEGDWKCPGCADHQFARNETCRKCGTPRPEGKGKGRSSPY